MLVLWICLCAFLNCLGWLLSAVHQLNRAGYLTAFALALAIWVVVRMKQGCRVIPDFKWRPRWRRWQRGFPLIFLILAALAILGGILHAPSNYDALAYRVPRMLHWLAAEQWHWIYTDFPRLNTRATGFEWVALPTILFTQTDRFIFLINAVMYLFLPGLFYGVLTGMGVNRRVAATWMWLLPTGYCYLLQAGSIGNDMIGGFYVLAAMSYALKARKSGSPKDFLVSILAAGLLSSGKTSNLPLLLPWAIAIAPAWRVLMNRPIAAIAVCLVAAGSSFVPISIINAHYVGDWTGLAAEGLQLTKGEPVVRVANNAVLLTIQNLVPPIFPVSDAWNREVVRFIPDYFAQKIAKDFEPAGAFWRLGEMEIEETAGIGFGISILLIVSAVAGLFVGRLHMSPKKIDYRLMLIRLGPWLALLVFMLKSNLSASARLAGPYYGLVVPLLLTGAQQSLVVRSVCWRRFAGLMLVPGLMVLLVSPGRPLWPAKTILTQLVGQHWQQPILKRALTVYSVYGLRYDGFKFARQQLPADANPLGFLATDETETSLWRPFGRRRILHIKATDNRQQIQARGISYVLVSTETWERLGKQGFELWCDEIGAERIATFAPKLRAAKDPFPWHLIRLRHAGEESPVRPQR